MQTKYFDPDAVDFFRCFTLENSRGESLFELRPIAYHANGGIDTAIAKHEAMQDSSSPERQARVAELARLYESMEPMGISPLDGEGV